MKDKSTFLWLEKYLFSIGGWYLGDNECITIYENAYFDTYIKLTNGGNYYEYEVEICDVDGTQTFGINTLLHPHETMHNWAWSVLNSIGLTKEYLSDKMNVLSEGDNK